MAWGNETRNLTQEIRSLHKDNLSYLRQMKEDVNRQRSDARNLLEELDTQHMESAKVLDTFLKNEINKIKSATRNFMAEADAQQKKRTKQTNEFLKSEMDKMKSATETLLLDTKNLMARISKEHKERAQDIAKFKNEMAVLVDAFKKEREEAADAWKELLRTLDNENTEKKVEVKARPQKAETRKARKSVSK